MTSETLTESPHPTPATAPETLPLAERFRRNPVVLKELRGRMRGNRAFVLLTIYVLAISLLIGMMYAAFATSTSFNMGSVTERQNFGKALFGVVVWLQMLMVTFVSPALTAGAISSERERQTYDLLRTTLLSARSLVLGKFFSGLVYVLLLLLSALPIQSLAFLFGGVGLEESIISSLILVTSAILFCAAGVFWSSLMHRTMGSTVLAYGFTILLVFGLPFLVLMMTSFLGVAFASSNFWSTDVAQTVLLVGGWFLVILNPLATALVSEIILLEEQSLFLVNVPLNSGSLPVISPWLPHLIVYLLISVLLIVMAIRAVKRQER